MCLTLKLSVLSVCDAQSTKEIPRGDRVKQHVCIRKCILFSEDGSRAGLAVARATFVLG